MRDCTRKCFVQATSAIIIQWDNVALGWELFHWRVLNPAILSLGSLRSWRFVSFGEGGKKAEKTRSNDRQTATKAAYPGV